MTKDGSLGKTLCCQAFSPSLLNSSAEWNTSKEQVDYDHAKDYSHYWGKGSHDPSKEPSSKIRGGHIGSGHFGVERCQGGYLRPGNFTAYFVE